MPLEEISNSLLGGRGAGLTFVVYGAIIVIIARFLPSGILRPVQRSQPPDAKPQRAEPAMLLDARNVTMAFGAFKAVDDASIAVEPGEILGLIGPNGAGKSTFFNCLTGDLMPTSGTVHFDGRDVTRLTPERRAQLGIARTFQVPLTFESMSVIDNVMIGAFLRYHGAAGARDKARAGDRLRRAGRAGRRPGTKPRHARPQAARDRPGAGIRAQGAAARRGDGRPDAQPRSAGPSSSCARSTPPASRSSSSSTSWR